MKSISQTVKLDASNTKTWGFITGKAWTSQNENESSTALLFSCMIVIWIKVANGWTPCYNTAINWLSFLWVWRVDGALHLMKLSEVGIRYFEPASLMFYMSVQLLRSRRPCTCSVWAVLVLKWMEVMDSLQLLVKNPLLLSLTGALHCRACFKTTSYLNEVKGEVCHFIWTFKYFLVFQLKGIVQPKIKLTENVLTLRPFEM